MVEMDTDFDMESKLMVGRLVLMEDNELDLAARGFSTYILKSGSILFWWDQHSEDNIQI